MIFIWTGQGGWIPGSLLLGICLSVGISEWVFAAEPPSWVVTLPIALSGLFCVGLGLFARFSPARPVRDRATGRERFNRPRHTAYWIRAEYWGLLYLGLAIWLQSKMPPGSGS